MHRRHKMAANAAFYLADPTTWCGRKLGASGWDTRAGGPIDTFSLDIDQGEPESEYAVSFPMRWDH